MFARLLILFYAIVSYAVFLVSFLYALGFVPAQVARNAG